MAVVRQRLVDEYRFAGCQNGFHLLQMNAPSRLKSKIASTRLASVGMSSTMLIYRLSRSPVVNPSTRFWLALISGLLKGRDNGGWGRNGLDGVIENLGEFNAM